MKYISVCLLVLAFGLFGTGVAQAALTANATALTSDGVLTITGNDVSVWSVASAAADDNLTVGITGATASSLILSSTGTGANAMQITTTAGGLDVSVTGNAASEDLDITTSGSATDILVTSAGTLTLDSAGVLELNSSAGIISIGNDAVAQNINIGTGAAARTITIGNTTATTGIALNAGSGNITVGGTLVLGEKLESRTVAIANTPKIFSYSSAVDEDAVVKERIKTLVYANGNVSVEMLNHSTQAWTPVGWYNLNDCNQGSACESWNFGQEIFWKVPFNTAVTTTAYFAEWDTLPITGGPGDVDTGAEGWGWLFAGNNVNGIGIKEFALGAEGLHYLTFLTSDTATPGVYPNSASRRFSISGTGAAYENVQVWNAEFEIHQKTAGGCDFGYYQSSNNLSFQTCLEQGDDASSGTPVMKTANGLDLQIEPADDLRLTSSGNDIYATFNNLVLSPSGASTLTSGTTLTVTSGSTSKIISNDALIVRPTSNDASAAVTMLRFFSFNDNGRLDIKSDSSGTPDVVEFETLNNFDLWLNPDNGSGDAALVIGSQRSDTPDARTIADDGAGTTPALALTPKSSFVTIDCQDSNGCTFTAVEAGAHDGQVLEVVSIGANALTISDVAGQQNVSSGAFAMGQDDGIRLRYSSGRSSWVETGRSDN